MDEHYPGDKKLRILFVSSSSGSKGGGEIALVYLAKALSDMGHQVGLWVSTHARMDSLAKAFSPFGTVIRYPYKNMYDCFGRTLHDLFPNPKQRAIIRSWENWNPDVLHLNKQNLEDGLDLLKALNESNIPNTCMIHITQSPSFLNAKMGHLRDFLSKKILRQYKGVYITTPETRIKELGKVLLPSQRIKMIHNAAPCFPSEETESTREEKRRLWGLKKNDLLVLSVGRLEKQKCPFKFLDTAQQIFLLYPHVKFAWIGDGSLLSEWNQRIENKKLHNIVFHSTWQDDVRPWLAAADVFLHLASFEGMPFAVLEALSARLPCVLMPELIKEIPPFKAPGILPFDQDGQWINPLLNKIKRKSIAENALTTYQSNFTFEILGKQYEKLFTSLLKV